MPTDNKTIDSYNKNASKWAKSKRDGSSIFHTYLEKPAIYGKLPNLHGKKVLCIGCGSGEEVSYLSSKGASVVGIDIAEGLIEVAKKSYPDNEFYVMDMEKLDFSEDQFDFAFSSLTMHYLLDWTKVLSSLRRILKDDGIFLFSITHPFFSGVERYEDEKVKSRKMGFRDHKDSEELEIYGDYFAKKSFELRVNNAATVSNSHRPLSDLVRDLVLSGFEILDIVEPRALDESKDEYKKFWEIHQKIPEFMILETRKKRLTDR